MIAIQQKYSRNMATKSAAVLILSGLDPSGDAGLCVDIKTFNAHGLKVLPIATILSVQNTRSILSIRSVHGKIITQQIKHLAEEFTFLVIKIGLLGNGAQIECIENVLKKLPHVQVVLDPIIKSSSQKKLHNLKTLALLKKTLIRRSTCLTPNAYELKMLAPNLTEKNAVASLDVPWVLVTKTDVSNEIIYHQLYHNAKLFQTFSYAKLAGNFHGSGCILNSAIAANIANGFDVDIACSFALNYTYDVLKHAQQFGKSQKHVKLRHIL